VDFAATAINGMTHGEKPSTAIDAVSPMNNARMACFLV
jgi:hypothetical protein